MAGNDKMPAVTFIDAVPKHISEEEHRSLTGATPVSFADIPPVLRHKVHDVSVAFDPPLEGFSGEDSARGTLYIIESVLAFQSSTTGRAFQIEYPSITLHAISRGESGPYVYCQLDDSPAAAVAVDDGDEDVPRMRELSLTPQPSDPLDPIFEALSICASLHPDPQGSDDEDADDDAFIDDGEFEVFTGAEGEELSEVGRAALAHLEGIIYDPTNEHLGDNHEADSESKINGAPEGGQFSDGEGRH